MKRYSKAKVCMVGAILLSGLAGQAIRADTIVTVESGLAILADVNGDTSAPEALSVCYQVTEDLNTDIYTYSYDISNPTGDQVLGGQNTGASEIVDTFKIAFDADAPGAYISGSATGGVLGAILVGADSNGLSWFIPSPYIAAGQSNTVTFESYLSPVAGLATAQDANPPSPWTSYPNGNPVPVPGPDATSTLALLGGVMALLPFGSALKKK